MGASSDEIEWEATALDELAPVESDQDQSNPLRLATHPRLLERIPLLSPRFLSATDRPLSGTATDRSADAIRTDSVWLRVQSRAASLARRRSSRRWTVVVG